MLGEQPERPSTALLGTFSPTGWGSMSRRGRCRVCLFVMITGMGSSEGGMRTLRLLTLVSGMLLGVMALGGCGVQLAGIVAVRPGSALAVAATGSRAGSFISVYPACGCGPRTVLERFSLADGRPLGALARIPAGLGVHVSAPHALPGGPVWLTISTGPKYRSGVAGGDPAPDSCSGKVEQVNPANGNSTTVLQVRRSVLITDAVPSPNRRLVVMPGGGCSTSFLNEHLIVENLKTHKQWTIGADAAPCHALFDAAWSANGSQLVFPYGPSILSPHTRFVPHGTCATPRFSRLAVVSASHTTPIHAWTLIKADPHCSYMAATFDRWGLAAIEGCTTGASPRQGGGPNSGNAYLVQLSRHGREVLRLPLSRGFDGGGITANTITGTVLVSEYQAANQPIPVHNTVWAFNGHALRTIHRYPNRDAPLVVAQPW